MLSDFEPREIYQNMAKILIIEDVKTESLIMKKILIGLGHIVLEASDGAEGLSMTEKEVPDLVLSDIVMPKMDGFQVCRKIRRGSATKDIPVILISSKTEESDKFWGIKQGATDYIGKPVVESALVEAVGKALA